MPSQGEDFHRLVEHLERALALGQDIKLESHTYLPSKTNGSRREFDIVLTYRQPLRRFVVAIECRDHGRKIDMPQVDGFSSKLMTTAVDKGIIVSSRGFTSSARTHASSLGIGCLTLAEAEEFEWIPPDIEVTTLERQVVRAELEIDLAPDDLGDPIEPSRLFLRKPGGEMNEQDLDVLGQAIFNMIPPDRTPGDSGDVSVDALDSHLFVVVDALGRQHHVARMAANFTYENRTFIRPVRRLTYGNGTDDGLEVAMFDVGPGSGTLGSMVMVRSEEGTKFSYVSAEPGTRRDS